MIRIKTELCSFYSNIYSLYLHTKVQIVSKLCIHVTLIDGQSRDGIPLGVRFSAPALLSPRGHPAFCVMNIGLFPEGKADEAWRGVALTIHVI